MAAIIGTTSKVADKHGTGLHGFTSGNAESGVPPTQLSADFFDAVTQEIANPILDAGYEALDGSNTEQLSTAIDYEIFEQHPRKGAWGQQTFRSELTSGLPVASAANWLVRRKTQSVYQATQNTTQTWCGLSVPDDSQFWVTFHGVCVQRDSLTTYSHIVLRCSCRKTGGTTTIQRTTTVDSDSAGLVVTWSVVNSSGLPSIRAVLPVAVGKTFNLMAYGEALNVIRI